MIEKSSLNSSDIEEISQIVTKLQWRAMEYRIIVKGVSSEKIINDYLLALGDLRKSVESIRKVQDVQKVIKCSEKFSEVSSDLLNLIAERSEIRIGDNK
jgi:replicative superfamily II helicase